MFYSNFVPKNVPFLRYLPLKNYSDLETGVWGHSRSSKMVPLDTAYGTSYSRSVATIALSRADSGI